MRRSAALLALSVLLALSALAAHHLADRLFPDYPNSNVVVTFTTSGACETTPARCPVPVVLSSAEGTLSAAHTRHLLSVSLAPLRSIDSGPSGCGDSAAGGTAVHATLWRDHGPHLPSFAEATFCLTAAADPHDGVQLLRDLHARHAG